MSVKFAVTLLAASIVTTQVPVPLQPAPLQPVKVEPVAGAAVTFKRLGPDVTPLKIITHELSDRNGVMIPATVQDGQVELAVMRYLYLPLVLR